MELVGTQCGGGRGRRDISACYGNMTFWNVDVSGRPSFPDPDTSREQTHTLGEKVTEADRLFPGCLYVWSSPPLFCGLLLPV